MTEQINKQQARQIRLQAQGLLGKPSFGKKKKGLLSCIEQIGYLQIDTISVVERAHHHTAWVRLPDYQAKDLDHLQLQDRSIFEYWSHAAAYLPMRDYRFSLFRKEQWQKGTLKWQARDPKVRQFVLDRITAEGPLRSKDFQNKGKKVGTWWDWKPSKIALEQLFHEGHLMISHRVGFQKVFDLPSRVLPPHVDQNPPSELEYIDYLIHYTIQALGLASVDEIGHLRKGMKSKIKERLRLLVEEKKLISLRLKSDTTIYFSFAQTLNNFKLSSSKKVHFLCPFDNAIIHRKSVQQFFDYTYKLECYVPEPKRVFGYYTMPILWGDQIAGQIFAKADRKRKVFIIHNAIFYLSKKEQHKFHSVFIKKLNQWRAFNQCDEFEINKNIPAKIRSFLDLD